MFPTVMVMPMVMLLLLLMPMPIRPEGGQKKMKGRQRWRPNHKGQR